MKTETKMPRIKSIFGSEEFLHPESGVKLYRKIAQPHVITFGELFTSAKPFDIKTKYPAIPIPDRIGQSVGSYCLGRTHDGERFSFSVRPADFVLSRIVENTIDLGDELFFQIVTHDNGWSLVTVSFNQIIGGFWLAYIKTDSIPKTYAAKFTGRQRGAIGIFYPIETECVGLNEKQAALNLYENWDHVSGLTLKQISQ